MSTLLIEAILCWWDSLIGSYLSPWFILKRGSETEEKVFKKKKKKKEFPESLWFSCSVMSDSTTPCTVAHQTPLSNRFSSQDYWSGLPCPPPEDLPKPGIEPTPLTSPALQTDINHWDNACKELNNNSKRYYLSFLSTNTLPSSFWTSFVFYKIVSKWSVRCSVMSNSLTDPMVCNPPGSSVHGILQARILEWIGIPFSRGSSWLTDRTQVSCIGRWILYHLSHQGSPSK